MLFSKSKKTDAPIPSISFQQCHAKTDASDNPGISVKQHLENVVSVCRILKKQLAASLQYLGDGSIKSASVHDVGKVSPGFQLKNFRKALMNILPELAHKPFVNFETNHAHIGACSLWSHVGKDDPFHCPVVAQITAMHHGKMKCLPSHADNSPTLGGEPWSLERKRLIQVMEKQYGRLDVAVQSNVERDFIAGMVTVSDWIGSDESFFPAEGLPADIDLETVAQTAVSVCGLCRPNIVPELSFEDIFGFPPFEIQERFGRLISKQKKPGVYILEAPMGMGKTEAALYAAYRLMAEGHNHGLFFGLPTRLTSDRIHERINPFLKKICADETAARLAHGTAWLKPFWDASFEKGGEEFKPGKAWFNPKKRALLHPFVVGTVDQALMSVLRVKHHFVRTFGLAGKVVILDEVHSYDGYTGTLIEKMTSQLTQIGCTVIILSATLTGERRAAFFNTSEKQDITQEQPTPDGQTSSHNAPNFSASAPYPLISGPTFSESVPSQKRQRYLVSMVYLSDNALAKHAVEKAMSGHCVLCIANTVAKAQAWYDAVSAEASESAFPMGLLHSKFPGFQRAEIEDFWMKCLGKEQSPSTSQQTDITKNRNHTRQDDTKRPNGCILIATQVVEQSVDIDADYLITELAPTDMLLQRMGREWRHARSVRPCPLPETLIISQNPDNADTLEDVLEIFGKPNCHVYAPWVLWRTRDVWETRHAVTLPDDIRSLLESTYTKKGEPHYPLQNGFSYSPDPSGDTDEMGTKFTTKTSSSATLKADFMKELYTQFETMREALERRANANLSTVTAMPSMDDAPEDCATRYSDLPTTQTLLVKQIDSTGNSARLTLLSGDIVTVDASRPDMAVTARLHLNLVTIPTWLISRVAPIKSPRFLKKHFYEPTPVLLWDETSGELTLDGKATDFRYTPLKGLFRKTEPNPEPVNPDDHETTGHYLSDFESVDLFDKSKFDW